MSENKNTGTTARKSLRDLSNPLEMRELNRQIEWIWRKLLGGLDVKAFSDGGVKTVVDTVEKVVADDLTAAEVTTNVLKAALSEMMVAEIGVADIDYAHIVDLITHTAIITEGEAGKLYIAKLAVTDENVVSLNADVITSGTLATDRLILTGENGVIYEINANSSGLTAAQLTKEEYQHQINGTVIISKSITTDQLAANSVTAEQILAGSIKTAHLDAQSVDATKMVAHTLTVNEVTSDFGQRLDLSSNQSINMIAQAIDTLTGRTEAAEAWITPHNILMVVSDGEDHSHLELVNSGLYVEGGVFGINVTGADGDTTFDEYGLTVPVINSPSVARRYCDSMTITIDASATEEQLESGAYFRSISDAFESLNDSQVDDTVTINIVGTFYENLELHGMFGGGTVIINDGEIVGLTEINACSCYIEFVNTSFLSSDVGTEMIGTGVKVTRSSYVEFEHCTFYGSWATSIWAVSTLDMLVNNCMFANSDQCVFYEYCNAVRFNNNTGVSVSKSYVGNESIGYISGTRPSGLTTDQRNGAQLFGTATVDTTTSTIPTVVVNTTQSFSCTSSNTYRSGWRGGDDVWQGLCGGRNYGCYWFDGLEAAISGKYIVSATLKLRRMTGYGTGASVALKVYACGNASPSGAVSVLDGGSAGSIKLGEQKTITISNAALQSIADGSAHGLVLDPGDTSYLSGKGYSANYARLNGIGSGYVPVLTVTYR